MVWKRRDGVFFRPVVEVQRSHHLFLRVIRKNLKPRHRLVHHGSPRFPQVSCPHEMAEKRRYVVPSNQIACFCWHQKKGVEWRHVETRYQHLRSMAHSRWLPIRAAVSSSLCRSVSAPEQTGRPWRPSSQGGMGGPPTYGKFNGWNADKSWNHHWICGSNFDTTPFAYLLEHPDFKHFRRHGNCGWIYGSFHASRSALTRFFSCPSSDLPWPITDGKAGPFVARIDQLLSMSISWVSTLGKIYIFTYYKCIFIYI